MLLELISDNSLGRIEAINEYTKHTLISFIQFIENDFKAQIIEKRENAEGKYKKDIYNNIEDYSSKYADNLNDVSNSLLLEFNKYLKHEHANLFLKYNKTSPIVVQQNPKSGKIFACHRNGKNIEYHFVISNKSNASAVTKLKSYLDAKGFKYFEDWAIIVKEKFDIETLKALFTNYIEILLSSKS
ncbi:MAG: hypothetical protein IPL55_07960 [Saprospiraceae bacterium]|nr:hypothetical protein [Saprospiraceae bacterium]